MAYAWEQGLERWIPESFYTFFKVAGFRRKRLRHCFTSNLVWRESPESAMTCGTCLVTTTPTLNSQPIISCTEPPKRLAPSARSWVALMAWYSQRELGKTLPRFAGAFAKRLHGW